MLEPQKDKKKVSSNKEQVAERKENKDCKTCEKSDFDKKEFYKQLEKKEVKQNSVEKSSNAFTIADNQPTKLNILLSSTEKENQSAKDIQNIFDKKLSKMLRIESGFINTNEFNFKAPKSNKKGVESFAKIVSKDQLRPFLTGVLIEKDVYVGTDAHKLLIIERDKKDGLKTGVIYDANAKYIDYLNAFANIDDALSEKEWNDKKRYIDGIFPNYQKVFPKQYQWKTPFVDIEPILNHVYKAYYLLKFDVQKNDNYTIPFRIGKTGISFNAYHLFDTLQCLYANGTKHVSFECVAYNKATIIKSKENKNVALLMPVIVEKKSDLNVNQVQISATENKDFEQKQGLAAPQPQLSTEDFKKMSVKELRAFTLQYYLENLKGKKAVIKKYLKEVVFTTVAGKKIAKGEAMYSAKAVAVTHLQELIENSTYNNWGDRKKTDGKDVLGYLNFKSKFILDGEKKHLRISLVLYKDRKTELKNVEVGRNKKAVKSTQEPVAYLQDDGTLPLFRSKNTKKSVSNKKTDENFGLGLPLTDEIRKKAFTDKGKLRKGWYYDKYGILTDGKKLYLAKGKKEYEYEAIQDKILDDETNYRHIRYQAEDYYNKEKTKNNEIGDEQFKTFYEDVVKSLKKQYPSITREDVFDIHNSISRKDDKIFFTFSSEDLKIKAVKDFLEEYAVKVGKKYELNEKAINIRKKIDEFGLKQRNKLRGNRKDIRKKYGLAAPIPTTQEPMSSESAGPQVFVEEFTETSQVQPEPVNPLPTVAHHRKGSLAQQLANAPEQTESYQIDRFDMAQFLGDMEIKNVDSLVITLTGGQGSGKTRFAFQFMNDLAQRYKVGHISIEEHPQSRLYIEKAHQYLNQNALNNIEAHDVRSLSEIDKIIRENEVIVIDSFQKIKEIDSRFEVDKDLRKKYHGKLFLVIFQQTTDGKMRGGSKSQFDGDIILFTEKFANYQENYVYPDKNRYNSTPADQLKYNIYSQGLQPIENKQEITIEDLVFDVV
ncbi:hypothetical protein RCZ15_25070 [Capnocytophaga catalasegens]|uniref:Large polyvalent protein-associated domain-containing protein n=1 Tax=Capnocytophaga catalasegens TaxID=1004260 RepID=A0AAV5AY36_9FLAO|nr:hypothetical protein RCZ03_22080 [Capnocytophaga catalasegens]GJM51534.1 hypothetical protein RCZ15_25070 [Capnocytophaga catalasegens]GJM53923.1 hypothetical protein RCZ16_22390 [Capnocytophaga catalasegens]